ncbi:MAG: serine/threonine-protein phosphatase [Ignavibacteriales bacterium]|nr:serine/threonine-protein phosphatase [Ignavibacteriales bacterium]
MQELTERISNALAKEEARAEFYANSGRVTFLIIMTFIALLNVRSVTFQANIMNFSILALGYTYGLFVLIRMRRFGYHPAMKYITSCLDIILVFLLLFLYTKIEIPAVALKNYVFVIIYPLIGLTVFRYDKKLTLVTGILAVLLYMIIITYLCISGSITMTWGGYDRELFSQDVTYIGQATKIILLIGFIALMAFLAQYSRRLIFKLVNDESKIRQKQEQIEHELRIASHVQQKFVPSSFPEVAGLYLYGIVEQGKFIGGDYCDFIKFADDRLLVVVADVSGNGIPAALIMAEVRASIHLLAKMEIGLEQLVERLNILLFHSTQKKHFVTFFAAEIDTTKQIISYVNAGHPSPLIYADGAIRTLKKGTIPLGVRSSLPNLTKEIEEFRSGSMIISYTDGLVEQFNSQEEQYGEQRLYEYFQSNFKLDAQTFAQNLLEEVKIFSKERTLDDDVGLVVVKFLD